MFEMDCSNYVNSLKFFLFVVKILAALQQSESNILAEDRSHFTLQFSNSSRTFSIRKFNSTICFLKLINKDVLPKELAINGIKIPATYPILVPIYDNVVNISSKVGSSFTVEFHQIQCPICAEITTLNFTFKELSRNNCLVKFKNSNRACGLHLDIQSFSGHGFIEIDKERVAGRIVGGRTIPFTEFLLIRNATINFRGSQQLCTFNASLIKPLILTSLPGRQTPENSVCFDGPVYKQRITTLISPEFPSLSRSHNCVYEIRKWNPSVCRLRLSFHYFWLGDGYDGICKSGYLEIDGYRFCGCQSSLFWTTSSNAFRDQSAFLKIVDEGRDQHFTSYLITIEQVQCGLQRAVNHRYFTKRNVDQTYSSLTNIPVPPRCPVPLVVVSPGGWQGSFTTPGYPRSYSNHFLQRFQLNRGFCGIEITFDDFDLIYTKFCTEEFVTLGNSRRFCGQELIKNTLRMTGTDMWVSLLGVGRGFQASYRLIPCDEAQYDGSSKPDTDPVPVCKHLYRQLIFTIQGPYSSSCTFIIRKTYPSVCKLKLKLRDVKLECGAQSLRVNGQYYCGRILEDNFELQFVNEVIEIDFNAVNGKEPGMFTIEGEQLICNLQEEQLRDECIVSLTSSQGKVESPALHPQPPENLRCTYKFVPLKGICFIQLDFDKLFLPADGQCITSYLSINDVKYCETSLSHTTKLLKLTAGKSLEVPYMIDKNLDRIWWNFTYTQVPC